MQQTKLFRVLTVAVALSMGLASNVHATLVAPTITNPTTTTSWVSGNGVLFEFTTTDPDIYAFKYKINDAATPTIEYASGGWYSAAKPYGHNITAPNLLAGADSASCVFTLTTSNEPGTEHNTGNVTFTILKSN